MYCLGPEKKTKANYGGRGTCEPSFGKVFILNVCYPMQLQLVDATLYLYNKKMECRKWYTEHE